MAGRLGYARMLGGIDDKRIGGLRKVPKPKHKDCIGI